VQIKLSEKQTEFVLSQAFITIYRGGIRSGKTYVLCYKALEFSWSGRRFCIVSFSYPMLRDVCIHTMIEILTENKLKYKYNKSEKTITPAGGVEILFRSGDEPDSLRGLSLDGFGIDEAREFKTREIFDVMIGRLSNGLNPQGYVTTSPKGRNWSYDLEENEDTVSIVQKTSENPFLPAGYIERLKSNYTFQFAAQELDADIVEFGAGIIKPDTLKICEPIAVSRPVRFWDLAVSIKKSADDHAGAKCGYVGDNFVVEDMIYGKMEYPDLRRRITQQAIADGTGTIIAIEEAGQQRGFIDDIVRDPALSMHTIRAVRPSGDKLNRALPWISRAEMGSVYLCRGAWNRPFVDQCAAFTANDSHAHDDMIDAVSGAYQVLNTNENATSTRISL
jgi:predicted phage terminase large subunit-like protein